MTYGVLIAACSGEQADGFEGDAVEPLLDRARFACPELASIAADYGAERDRRRPRRKPPQTRLQPPVSPVQRSLTPPAGSPDSSPLRRRSALN
jgi:hypothetical protein